MNQEPSHYSTNQSSSHKSVGHWAKLTQHPSNRRHFRVRPLAKQSGLAKDGQDLLIVWRNPRSKHINHHLITYVTCDLPSSTSEDIASRDGASFHWSRASTASTACLAFCRSDAKARLARSAPPDRSPLRRSWYHGHGLSDYLRGLLLCKTR